VQGTAKKIKYFLKLIMKRNRPDTLHHDVLTILAVITAISNITITITRRTRKGAIRITIR
jgi:hypothetical protein